MEEEEEYVNDRGSNDSQNVRRQIITKEVFDAQLSVDF